MTKNNKGSIFGQKHNAGLSCIFRNYFGCQTQTVGDTYHPMRLRLKT